MQGWAEGKWTKEPVCYCAGPDPLWWKRWVPSRKRGSARDEVENGVRPLMCVCWWLFRTSLQLHLTLILGFLTSEVYFRGTVRVHNPCSGTTIFMVCSEMAYAARQRGICNPAVQLDGWDFESKICVSAKYIQQISETSHLACQIKALMKEMNDKGMATHL